MSAPIIDHMRRRIQRCRELAQSTTDPRASKILLQMVAEGEADIKRLLDETRERGAS
jgi:hypothetical protein